MPPIGNISSRLLELLLSFILFPVEGQDDLVTGLALHSDVYIIAIPDAVDLMPHVAAEIRVTTRRHFLSPSGSQDTCRP